MKKIFHLFLLVVLLSLCLTKSHFREIEVKTNIPYWGITTPDLSIETTLGKKEAPDCQAAGNPCILSCKEKKKKTLPMQV